VVGERDLQAGIAQLKDLSTGDQTAVALTELVDHLQERFP
jgi:histidyl-tRNA synthetase